MLPVLLMSVFTTSLAFTTHRYDVYENYGEYRPIVPLTDNIYSNGNSNGRRPVQTYELPRKVDGVMSSGVLNQGPVINGNEWRWTDEQYSYQNPNQRNYRPVPLNRVAVTQPTKNFIFFQNSDQNRKYDTGTVSRPTKENDQAVNKINEANKLNKTEGNGHVSDISTQSHDVNRTFVINEQITWNYDQHGFNQDNANVSTRSIDSNSNFNYLTPKQDTDKIYLPTKTNNTSVNNNKTNQFDVNTNYSSDNNKVRSEPNATVDRFNNETNEPRYGTKTTQDNEVTPKIELKPENAVDDDRWVWGNADDKIVETTTLVNLDDRAAFTGNACPQGKVKVGDRCVTRDS
ncbi:hypothetical protein B5X24_HaOG203206 [Helicoverpa armigera]|uniref:Uncharacterized protein n=1 Tax=Helicoverpa armigera TaxID=29058 RepID=A0A2W1C0I3_HELAM|nr:hypothetical protein B5X24_HaOG203206 [Helicoverpa armigera]